jgi:hypothetical protein
MIPDLGRCPDCGKLFVFRRGKTRCAACNSLYLEQVALIEEAIELSGCRTLEEIASYADLPVKVVERIVEKTPTLAGQVAHERLCSRCGEKPSQKGSRYCLSCRLTLNKGLGEAARQLSGAAAEARRRSRKATAQHVGEAVRQKRARAPVRRLRPAPQHKLK